MSNPAATAHDKTVFISYRRSVSRHIARSVFIDLRYHGYDVFMDVESIDSGIFDTIILNQIAARAHFLLVLTKGSLDRCTDPADWLRREIERAIALRRNVVPLLFDGFQFDASARRILTGRLEPLLHFNALPVPHEYFDEAMHRLRTRFLKQPVLGQLLPPPPREEAIVRRKIASLVRETGELPPPPPARITPPRTVAQFEFPSVRRPVTAQRGSSSRRKEIEQRVVAALNDLLGVDPSSITARTRFVEDLRADSLDLIELTMMLEEEFGGQISDEDAVRITTVGEAIAYIDAHLP